jgi:hypothetical protein
MGMLSITSMHRDILTFLRVSDGSDSPVPKTPAAKKGKAKTTGYVAVSNILLRESTLTRNFLQALLDPPLAPSPRAKARLL